MALRRHPFTFLELGIAVTILLALAVVLFGYSRSVSQSWSKLIQEKNRFQEILTLDRTLDAILANAVPFTWTSDDATREDGTFPFVVAGPDALRIAYLHDLHDAGEGALRFGELYVQEDNLYLRYSDRPFYQWEDLQGREQTALLAEQVDGLSFAYLDWSDDEDDDWEDRWIWTDSWETEDSGRKDIPLAIQVTVHWSDGRQESWVRRTMGNSYRERFGKWDPLSEDNRK